ncbi:ABC-2 transporter permease [Lysinibacillus sp. CNPSo 3705]|uniref:ABC-2 transporter permease n=1 Tax=Lysinibacillus sp. CNPSo 3705 TaxID=3028148 RepID=UPI002363FB29|nr:ABC-2 transporter permease [Lysinibacillus sp. CNPSo 3705]MDD1501281.1 ABC-2 transporter permease [Lysinibacillus sp. CNPSo 3705]
MAGLILKDLMTIQRQLKTQAFVLIFFLFISIFMQQGLMLFTIIIFIVTFQTITALTYDEQSSWDKYANTLPISKGDIVLSKYILSILLMLFGLILALPIVFIIHRFTNNWASAAFFPTFILLVTLAFCMLALLLPIYIKFGSIKGRMVLIALCFIPGFLFGLLKEYFPDMTVILSNLKPYMFVAPFAGLLILWLSSLISTAIYQQKEF